MSSWTTATYFLQQGGDFPRAKKKKNSKLENLLNPMTCKGWRWQSHMGASAWCFCGSLILLRLLLICQTLLEAQYLQKMWSHWVSPLGLSSSHSLQKCRTTGCLLCSSNLLWLPGRTHSEEGVFFPLISKLVCKCPWRPHKTQKSLWAKMQWSMRWAPSLHGSLAYAGTKTKGTPVSHCFNKQQLASGVATESMHEFGRHKAVMSKSHMSSCVTNEKVWKEPRPVQNWLIQWVLQIFCGSQWYCPASQPERGTVLLRAAIRYQTWLGKWLDFYLLL